jgi:hypothetical protein
MTTRKDRSTSGIEKGLRRAVSEATHPTMKQLGEIALTRGFSQEGLADALRQRFKLRINGANVYAHFTAIRPQRETINRYVTILGVTPEQMQVVERGVLDADRVQRWEHEVFRLLSISKADFEPGVVTAVRKVLRDPATRTKVLTDTAMTWLRDTPGWSMIPSPLSAFAAALFPWLDLRDFIRKRVKGEATLFMIYTEALSLYDDATKARAFVDACAAILRIDGFDTRAMYERLRNTLHDIDTAVTVARRKKGHNP